MPQAQFAMIRLFGQSWLALAKNLREQNKSGEWVHHEQYPKFQSNYKSDVIALVVAFEPFLRTQQRATGLEPVTGSQSSCLQMW